MNTATIAIPERWQAAMGPIKRFVEHYAELHSAPFNVILTYQLDAGEIYLVDDSLTQFEREVCQNAIWGLSSQLNANLSTDPWQASADVTDELKAQLKYISDFIDREIPPRA
jgi:hypothetical protein